MVRRGIYALGILAASLLPGVAAPAGAATASEQDLTGFYGNPHEREEAAAREAEYRKLYDEELAEGGISQVELLRRVFTPRVADEVFDTGLPGIRPEGQLNLTFNPKFGDFFGDAYIRLPFGARYNFSRYFEVFTELGAYVGNPFDGNGGGGLYNWRSGGKYSWMEVLGSRYNLAVGAAADLPVTDPPVDLTDGYARYEPFATVSRQLPSHPHWLVYLNLAYQFVADNPFESTPIQPQPRDRLFLRPGVIYYPGGNFRYSLEIEYRTNALDFRRVEGPVPADISAPLPGFRYENWVLAHEEVHEVTVFPAVTWFPTREARAGLRIPGNWDLGLQLKLPVLEETGQDFGVSVRFRWYYDYRKLLAKDIPALFSRGK